MADPASHHNNFNALRLFAAIAVIFYHAYLLQGVPGHADPFTAFTGIKLGWVAVNLFFVVSGYLLTQSLYKNADALRFIVNRAVRIFPGLAVCLVATTILLGLFASTLSIADFFTSRQTWAYLVKTLTLIQVRGQSLPGVFVDNPHTANVNGSLWTLVWEVICYVLLLLASVSGLLKRPVARYALPALLALALLFPVARAAYPELLARESIDLFHRLGFAFLLGTIAAVCALRAGATAFLACLAVAILLHDTIYGAMAATTAIAAGALWLGNAHIPAIAALQRTPDYSYGLYIYAFPIQQLLVLAMPGTRSITQAIVALLLTTIAAAASRHLVETPTDRWKFALTRWRTKAGAPAPPSS